jgi:hypothetical protein
MIRVHSDGDNFKKTRDFIDRMLNRDIYGNLDGYARLGVDALAGATPVATGLTQSSWSYSILRGENPGIQWTNHNTVGGTPLVILLQYGHGTGTGGYVLGRDFINPAIRPIFDNIADAVWKEVTR